LYLVELKKKNTQTILRYKKRIHDENLILMMILNSKVNFKIFIYFIQFNRKKIRIFIFLQIFVFKEIQSKLSQ
jgi:hypothetical protein